MSNFQWDPAKDQTYTTADGTQAVFTHTIDKCLGTSFTMNAVEQTLTLQLQKPCTPLDVDFFHWGIKDPKRSYTGSEVTSIEVLEGTLEIKGLGQQAEFDTDNVLYANENMTLISTSGYGALVFSDFSELNLAAERDDSEVYGKINVAGNSLVSIKNCDLVNIYTDTHISEFGTMEISCNQFAFDSASDAIFVVASQPDAPNKYSFLCEISGTIDPSHINNIGSMIFKGNSTSKICTTRVDFASHLMEDNAKLRIEVDDYSQAGTINIGAGTPEIIIAPYSKGFVFDILEMLSDDNYPQGLFNFITRDGMNKGTLRLSASEANGFGFDSLIKKGIIYIDDAPAKIDQLMSDYIDAPGFITVRVRS